ncbi:hypothetical protein JAAARDRAFT_63800 [Jaapia argillacea MUCL 33604]|uniref:F-box domain-containing protein n=1 Tax=Jaapia argillacea MUCL 33604 TaxID=933084 RepID=A0A067PDV8_9AGAM|nr:hypothetical protein JAAARDRAFT_63800 [Jaapia argillacea MUCL 33604]
MATPPSGCTTMDDFPAEILQHIFSFACLDGGRTGRTLSLVSRHIRAVSKSTKYQSIALEGIGSMERFLEHLAGMDSDPDPLFIRYLFLSRYDPPPINGPVTKPSVGRRIRKVFSPDSWLSSIASDLADPNWLRTHTDTHKFERIYDCTFRVIAGAAPTLQVLAIVIPHPRQIPLQHISFPALRDLTVFSTEESRLQQSLAYHNPSPHPRPILPSLRRIHLSGLDYLRQNMVEFIKATPSLTHTCFTGLDVDGTLKPVILGLVDAKTGTASADSSNSPFPRPENFQKCFVRPRLSLHRFREEEYSVIVDEMRQCARNHEGLVLTRTIFEDLDVDNSVDEARGLWFDTIAGGIGCWNESDIDLDVVARGD